MTLLIAGLVLFLGTHSISIFEFCFFATYLIQYSKSASGTSRPMWKFDQSRIFFTTETAPRLSQKSVSECSCIMIPSSRKQSQTQSAAKIPKHSHL